MNDEETNMGDDDRFVLRRGTQGNEWDTLGRIPEEPEPPKPGPLAGVRDAMRRAAQWLRARQGGLRGSRAGSETPPVQPEEPGWGWAPMPPQPQDPRVAVPWSEVALARPKVGAAKAPTVTEPKLSAPEPNLSEPHLARAKPPRLPKMKAPIVTFSGLRLRGLRFSSVRDDVKGPLAVFGGLALASLIALGAIVAIETIGGRGSDGELVIATQTPQATETPQGTPGGTPIKTADPTDAPAPTAKPSATEAPPTIAPTAVPTARPTATPGGVVPAGGSAPQGGVGVAYWSNKLGRWWFGDLADAVGTYEEGQAVPFMVRWDGAPGVTYWLRITFDCAVPNVSGALDYLSGVQSYGGELATAAYGPGNAKPDGAIPVPDIPNFDPDDSDSGVFWLWRAKFPVLPLPPHPGDNCDSQRTQDIPIQAYGGPIVFLGSGHLGSATVYSSGEGASRATQPFGLHITVDGVGGANVMIYPSAVADFER